MYEKNEMEGKNKGHACSRLKTVGFKQNGACVTTFSACPECGCVEFATYARVDAMQLEPDAIEELRYWPEDERDIFWTWLLRKYVNQKESVGEDAAKSLEAVKNSAPDMNPATALKMYQEMLNERLDEKSQLACEEAA